MALGHGKLKLKYLKWLFLLIVLSWMYAFFTPQKYDDDAQLYYQQVEAINLMEKVSEKSIRQSNGATYRREYKNKTEIKVIYNYLIKSLITNGWTIEEENLNDNELKILGKRIGSTWRIDITITTKETKIKLSV